MTTEISVMYGSEKVNTFSAVTVGRRQDVTSKDGAFYQAWEWTLQR